MVRAFRLHQKPGLNASELRSMKVWLESRSENTPRNLGDRISTVSVSLGRGEKTLEDVACLVEQTQFIEVEGLEQVG
jgi:hypothetical protein